MSSCWKCGAETPSGVVECERCETAPPSDLPADFGETLNPEAVDRLTDAFRKQRIEIERDLQRIRETRARAVGIDWEKVKSADDLKEVVSVLFSTLRVMPGTPIYEELKRFLYEPPKET